MNSILTDEEINDLLEEIDSEEYLKNMEIVDKMIWIQNCVHRGISDFIEDNKKYPTIKELIHIYNTEFTAKFDIIRNNNDVHWMCYDMVKMLKGNVPYDLKIDENKKTIEVIPLAVAY